MVALVDGDVEAVLLEEPGGGQADHSGSDDGDALGHGINFLSGGQRAQRALESQAGQASCQGSRWRTPWWMGALQWAQYP